MCIKLFSPQSFSPLLSAAVPGVLKVRSCNEQVWKQELKPAGMKFVRVSVYTTTTLDLIKQTPILLHRTDLEGVLYERKLQANLPEVICNSHVQMV